MKNHLKDQTSPYLLQHADNPVDWYPWCREAFERARKEEKPIFLSIGYSTCHWCHVMARESFEDEQIAKILNRSFISIKVDREERPDIDSIYMAVCQAMTGSGGWPTTVFLTPDQRPFFAGTYFPKTAGCGQIGLEELLLAIREGWQNSRAELLRSADWVVAQLREPALTSPKEQLPQAAFAVYRSTFDREFGGFGSAPKFPAPHNLLFLMKYYEKSKEREALEMAERTLLQMYRGGMFDHIGGGFCRYSTDRYFLVPHFEKMLYDNALLIMAYCKAYQLTGKFIYRNVAEKTADYVLRGMTASEGGFFSAQDADSEGEEGKYYLLAPEETVHLLGEEAGKAFNEHFGIRRRETEEFAGSIPNLLHQESEREDCSSFEAYLPILYEYRKKRCKLHLDDKILTSWNGLMIGALCWLYRVSGEERYFQAARRAQEFLENRLMQKDTLYVSFREGRRGARGFLEDYAAEIFALLALYEAGLDNQDLDRARRLCTRALEEFFDWEQGGFYLYGEENEPLILRPKEIYDGAIPSGNSMMAWNLVKLSLIMGEKPETKGSVPKTEDYGTLAKRQLDFLSAEAGSYPSGSSLFLLALLDYQEPPEKVTVAVKNPKDLQGLSPRIPLDSIIRILGGSGGEYPLKNDRTTFYVCRDHRCLPPSNEYKTGADVFVFC